MNAPLSTDPSPEKRPSLRKAIDAHCKWCIYDPKSGLGNWRQQVTACTITRCNLWPVRPISRSDGKTGPEQTEDEDFEAILKPAEGTHFDDGRWDETRG